MEITKAYLEKVTNWMKKWEDKGCRPLELNVGEMVMVKLTQEQFC